MTADTARMTSSQFEIERDGYTSYLAYEKPENGWISLLYTEVAKPLRGRGIAKELARMAFEYAKANGLQVEVICPVSLRFALKNPEYKTLIGMRSKQSTNPQ